MREKTISDRCRKFASMKRAAKLCGQRRAKYCAIEAIILITLAQCLDWLAVVFRCSLNVEHVLYPRDICFRVLAERHSRKAFFLKK